MTAAPPPRDYSHSHATSARNPRRDLGSLPAIESAIERFDFDDRQYVAMTLAAFQSERADAIAVKYIEDEDDLARYRESR